MARLASACRASLGPEHRPEQPALRIRRKCTAPSASLLNGRCARPPEPSENPPLAPRVKYAQRAVRQPGGNQARLRLGRSETGGTFDEHAFSGDQGFSNQAGSPLEGAVKIHPVMRESSSSRWRLLTSQAAASGKSRKSRSRSLSGSDRPVPYRRAQSPGRSCDIRPCYSLRTKPLTLTVSFPEDL